MTVVYICQPQEKLSKKARIQVMAYSGVYPNLLSAEYLKVTVV